MKVGDLFEGMLILEVWDFEKYCSAADEAELEYDIDEAWEHWQEAGPMIVLLDSGGQELVKRWSR